MSVVIPAAGVAATQPGDANITIYAAGICFTVDGAGENEWPIKPFVSFAWENLDHDDVDIGSGATALDTAGDSFDRTVIGYGLAVNEQIGSNTALRAIAQANHYLGDTRIGLLSRFFENSSEASIFQTTGEDIEEQYRFELGLNQALGHGWRLGVEGQAELGGLQGNGGKMTVSKRF